MLPVAVFLPAFKRLIITACGKAQACCPARLARDCRLPLPCGIGAASWRAPIVLGVGEMSAPAAMGGRRCRAVRIVRSEDRAEPGANAVLVENSRCWHGRAPALIASLGQMGNRGDVINAGLLPVSRRCRERAMRGCWTGCASITARPRQAG